MNYEMLSHNNPLTKKKLSYLFKVLFLFLIINTFFLNKNIAQNPFKSVSSNLYFSPFITLGYTFNSGFNYGIDLTIGLFKIQNNIPPTNAGFSIQYYFVNYENSNHRIIAFNVIAESEYFRIGTGVAEIKKKWGYKDRNKTTAFGTSFDFGISTNSVKTPWLAFKTFAPQQKWEWSKNPYYVSLYTYFKPEPFYMLKNH